MTNLLNTEIEFLKGIGPAKASLLKKEKGISNFGDFLEDFPFRYIDKTNIIPISALGEMDHDVLIKGELVRINEVPYGKNRRRLHAWLKDESGQIELVWFQSVKQLSALLKPGTTYLAYGKPKSFKGKKSIPHPEMEVYQADQSQTSTVLAPVYSSTEKLTQRGLGSKTQRRLKKTLLQKLKSSDVPENLADYFLTKLKLIPRFEAYKWIHFPENTDQKNEAIRRLKFEELFFMQLRLWKRHAFRRTQIISYNFSQVGEHFNQFYSAHLPFELTGAQKRVVKEIRKDMGSGVQMNRLLQGDVGSGKTIVALLAMLIAIDNGFQSSLMAPTEILAQQHFNGLSELLEKTNVNIALLTGSIKGKKRKAILENLQSGELHILIGTHALIEDPVIFHNLGLSITDEQHRFGVEQRAKLWRKAKPYPPHILVMTATPIPRTLSMTLYGDLDVSVIDELPPGRKPVQTKHYRERHRPQVIEFMKSEIAKGRQIYVVYPLIEESDTLDLANLGEGYDYLLTQFPRPTYQMALMHGRMKAADKEMEMQRFKAHQTQILIATTVIEVGVNIPNASVMIIENAERFGLSQLHQLRGRVGRGGEQSFCILMSGYKLTDVGKERLRVMCSTNDGFEIAEADLKIRGPGEMEGTRQSGDLGLKLSNPIRDQKMLTTARHLAKLVLDKDPRLENPINRPIKQWMEKLSKGDKRWGNIS